MYFLANFRRWKLIHINQCRKILSRLSIPSMSMLLLKIHMYTYGNGANSTTYWLLSDPGADLDWVQ